MANHTPFGNVAVGAPNSDARKEANAKHLSDTENVIAAMRSGFEFGFRCAEKGLNLQAALEQFDKRMRE